MGAHLSAHFHDFNINLRVAWERLEAVAYRRVVEAA